jgi:hypothetical protein
MKWLFTIPQIPVDPEHPELGMKNEFTDNAWAKEAVRRWIISQVKRYEEVKAKEALNVAEDNTLIT